MVYAFPATPTEKAGPMSNPVKIAITCLALSLAAASAAPAFSIFESEDNNDFDNDPTNDYGTMSGLCVYGTGFTVQYQSDSRGRPYFADNYSGPSPEAVISRICANHGG